MTTLPTTVHSTDDMITLRRSFVMDLVIAGESLNNVIAKKWNEAHPAHHVSASTIASDRKAVMDMLTMQTAMTAMQVRELQAARLNQVILTLQPRVLNGDLQATDRYLKAVQQQTRLYGAEMPTKIAYTDPTGTKEASFLSEEERLMKIMEIMDAAALRHADSVIEAEVVQKRD